MTTEIKRLQEMLKERKISPADYKILLAAIEKKSSRINTIFSLAINPFQKVAGLYALTIGLVMTLVMSYLGVIAKMYFTGLLGILNSTMFKNPIIQPTFFLLFYQNIVAIVVLAVLYIIAAKLCKQKRLRIVDFFGTVALSRFPFFVLTIILALIQIIDPSFLIVPDLSKQTSFNHMSLPMTVFSLTVLTCGIWQIVTYCYALKESSGLVGKKFWISFMASIVIGEIIASVLTNIFF